MRPESYSTPNGITVTRTISKAPYARGLHALLKKLDTQRGVYFSSGYEYPERYARWDFAAVAPPLEIISAGREVTFHALNERGKIMNRIFAPLLRDHPHWESFQVDDTAIHGTLKPLEGLFPEEERSKQPSAFSMLRVLVDEFRHPLASRFALVGAFGYDLLLQFDPIHLKLPRSGVKDLHLFLCDDIWFMDRKKEQIERFRYDISRGDLTTQGVASTAERLKKPKRAKPGPIVSDHEEAEYVSYSHVGRDCHRRSEEMGGAGD